MSFIINPTRFGSVTPNVCIQNFVLACDITTTSTIMTDTCIVITVANRCGGHYFISVAQSNSTSSGIQNNRVTIANDGVIDGCHANTIGINQHLNSGVYSVGPLDGSVMRVRWRTTAVTATMRAGSRMDSLEVGG